MVRVRVNRAPPPEGVRAREVERDPAEERRAALALLRVRVRAEVRVRVRVRHIALTLTLTLTLTLALTLRSPRMLRWCLTTSISWLVAWLQKSLSFSSGLSRLTVMTISFLTASTCAVVHTAITHEGIGK